MSNYSKIVDYAAKDALNTGDPVKLVKGTELGAEYDAIATAIATKANTASPAFTGVSGFAVGAVGAPSIYMTGYATTGWYNIGANNWGFAVSGAKVLDISSTGLAVTGTLSATSALTLSGTGQVLIATAASAADKYVTISNTNGTLEYGVLAGGEGFIGTSTADNLKLQVNGSVVGNISSTGLAVTGTTSTTTGMAVGGATAGAGGIAFPATAVAVADVNTLDDYEEGTWTPTVAFGGASVGVTYGTQAGRYTIIGDRCFGSCEIILTSKGSSTGAASIGGLPATVSNASGSYSPVSLRINAISFADFLMGYCNASTTTILLEQTTNAGATSSLSDANFSNTAQIMASFNFKIA